MPVRTGYNYSINVVWFNVVTHAFPCITYMSRLFNYFLYLSIHTLFTLTAWRFYSFRLCNYSIQ